MENKKEECKVNNSYKDGNYMILELSKMDEVKEEEILNADYIVINNIYSIMRKN